MDRRRLRLGVTGTGSIPVCIFALIVFALLLVRLVSLVLENVNPGVELPRGGKESRVKVYARLFMSGLFESAWTIGLGVVAGPLLLT